MPRMTVADIRSKYLSSDEKISMLTAYDYPCAAIADRCGVDVLLIGDSLGAAVLGYTDITEVTVADMVHHTAAVSRAAKRSFVLSDLPAGTVDDPATALAAARALLEAGADGVKIEVDRPSTSATPPRVQDSAPGPRARPLIGPWRWSPSPSPASGRRHSWWSSNSSPRNWPNTSPS